MSIADSNRIAELEARVSALEKILLAGTKQIPASDVKPIVPAALQNLSLQTQQSGRETLKVRRG